MVEHDDDHPTRPTSTADEALLAPFFAVARAEAAAPTTALLSAILADAAAASASRAAQPAPAPRARRRLEPIGGWRGLAALAACALLGLWLGLAGRVSLDAAPGWTGLQTADDVNGDEEVGAFFDLASVEG
jgi:hypothetical protein